MHLVGYTISKPEAIAESILPYKFYRELYKDWNMRFYLPISELSENSDKWFYDKGLNSECKITTARTLIKWTETDMDMVKAEYICFKSGSVQVAKIWVNDELKWNSDGGSEEDLRCVFTKILK